MRTKCAEGEIYRKGYTRKSFTRNGSRVKGSRVKGGCIKSVGGYEGKRSTERKQQIRKTVARQARAVEKTPKVRCPKGMQQRSPYFRKSHSRVRSGKKIHIKGVYVPASCMNKSKSKVRLGPLMSGSLSQYGYEDIKHLSKEERHSALKKAMKEFGPISVSRKLNVLYILQRNRDPILSNKFKSDRDWVLTHV